MHQIFKLRSVKQNKLKRRIHEKQHDNEHKRLPITQLSYVNVWWNYGERNKENWWIVQLTASIRNCNQPRLSYDA